MHYDGVVSYDDQYKPAYTVDPCYPVDQTQVAIDYTGTGAEESKPRWNWCVHGCSVFTMLCCCWCICCSSLFGLIGLLFSTSAYTDHKSADYESSKYKKKCSLGWMLAGMILGLATIGVAAYFGYTYRSVFVKLYTDIQAQITSILSTVSKVQAAG